MEFHVVYFSTAAVLCFFFMYSSVAAKNEKDFRTYYYKQSNYDKCVRPVVDAKDVIFVKVEFIPIMLREVDDEYRTFALDGWLILTWRDSFLQWSPAGYDGLKQLRLPATEVWLPDLVFFKGTSETSHLPVNTNVVISNDGNVVWTPSFTVKASCYNLRPTVLRANCTLSLLSWTYDDTQLDISLKNETTLDFLEKGFPGWYVVGILSEKNTKYFPFSENPRPVINFIISLRRRVF